MRESSRSHGFMKTGSGKLASSLRSIHPQYRVGAKSVDGGDDTQVRAMWDEEFLGHDLPPNYIISREGSADEHHSKRKDSGSSRRDFTELNPREQAMLDEEFLGHELPSNYRISREKTSDDLTGRRVSDRSCRRGPKKSNSGEKTGSKGAAHRHARLMSEDTLEYQFDRTVDTYVLCDKKPTTCKDNGISNRDNGGGCRSGSMCSKGESCPKAETFEERALRFGVEDWNLVSKKWSHTAESKSSRRSSRRGIFHSPSGSDTSSLVSTLESSSFSCGSEGSSLAKGDYSSAGYAHSNGYSASAVMIPLSVPARLSGDENGVGEKVTDDGQFVELTLLDRSKPVAPDSNPDESCRERENGNFLEFNFLDGRMVESPDDEDLETDEGNGQNERKFSIRLKDEDASSDELAERSAATPTVYQSATTQSPESESFFGSSHDSDWSGTHSVSTERGGPISGHDGGDQGDVDDDVSVYTEDRNEEWSTDAQFFDANSSSASKKAPTSKEHIQLYPEDRMASLNDSKQHREILRSFGKPTDAEKRTTKANLTQGSSRRARSLGSVLSQHLAFTAIPSLRQKAQLGRGSDKKHYPWADGDSPAKVSAACIEWLWAEKGHMKPVQSLRALAAKERELAQTRENLAKGGVENLTTVGEVSAPRPPVRNLEASFKEGKASPAVLRKAQSNIEKNTGADVPRSRPGRSGSSPVRVAWRDPSKESRASILASWAAVYGLAESSSERIKAHSKGAKVSLLSTSTKTVRSGTPVKRTTVGSGGSASPRTSAKARSRLSRHVPKNLALELEVLCRPFGPVLKGVRCLPTAKRGQGGRPSFFTHSQSGDLIATEVPSTSSSSTQVASSTLQSGRLQCVVTRDGLPSYSLIMDESEEIFVAKTQRVDVGLTEGITHVYTFHSYRGKGKNKITHWKQWGKKEKPCSDFAGNMKVTSTISPLLSCHGVQSFVESEFVLLDAKVKEISISAPTSNSYPRSSFSSWDATPLRSPRLPSSAFSSPSSTYFSLPSPAGAAFSTSEGGPGSMPALTLPSSRYVSQSMPSAAVISRPSGSGSGSTLDKSSSSLDKGMLRLRQLERHATLSSPLQYKSKVGYSESWSDTETLDDTESRITRFLPQSLSELAAVVVRAPLGREQEKCASACDKWGWGINFLKKDSTPDKQKAGSGTSPPTAVKAQSSNEVSGIIRGSNDVGSTAIVDTAIPSNDVCSSGNGRDQVCGSCGNIPVNERCKGGMSVSLILPVGNHGCSANGVDGPQPLVERWKSGGKCDCGSWDLGCGMTVLGNQKTESSDKPTAEADEAELQDNTLRLYIQGKKHESMGLTLTALREGCYTLGFQAPISPLHAFATAVAVLHSRDPVNATKAVGDAKRRAACRAAAKVASCTTSLTSTTNNTLRSVATRPSGETFCVKPLASYQLVCPDPPPSPFGRA